MNIPESVFNISLFEKIEEDAFSCISENYHMLRFNETFTSSLFAVVEYSISF